MLRKIKNNLVALKNDQRGNTMIMTGFLIVPLLGLAGGAVDLVRYSTYEAELQSANDAAILAASKLIGGSTEEQKLIAYDYLEVNLSDSVSGLNITSKDYKGPSDCTASNPAAGTAPTSCLEIDAEMDTYFMKLFNIPTLAVSASSQATVQMQPMEIAFGFDTTGSMKFGNRWDDATSALGDMLQVLQDAVDADASDNFRVSLIPFSDRPTLPDDLKATVYGGSGSTHSSYRGCIAPREENISGNPFTLTDKSPTDLAFTPSQNGNYGDVYDSKWPWKKPICPNIAMIPVTDDVEAVQTALDDLTAAGTGRFDVGAAWVWRALSPKWKGLFGDADYPKDYLNDEGDENVKVAVIITDGNTVAYREEVWEDWDPASPSNYNQPYGFNKGSPEGFENMVAVCNDMADEGIHVHMVHVGAGENTTYHNEYFGGESTGLETREFAQRCASEPEYYHPVDDIDDLVAAFRTIGEQTSQLRLTQ